MKIFNFKRINYRLLVKIILILLLIIVLDSIFFISDRTFEYLYRSCDIIEVPKEYDSNSEELYMYTFDVGQSESILLLYQDTSILVDSGTTDYAYPLVQTLKSMGITSLDYCIFTHPHYDHMGGSSAIIRDLKPSHVYLTKYNYNKINKWWYEIFKKTVFLKGQKLEYLEEGSNLSIGDLKIDVICPISNFYENLNDYSLGMKVTLGETDILLLADIEASSEHDLIESDYDLQAEILKVPHHGSTTSSTFEFLYNVKPDYAIISVGKDNSYNHPRTYTLSKLNALGVTIYRTDQNGTILVTTDGNEINIITSN